MQTTGIQCYLQLCQYPVSTSNCISDTLFPATHCTLNLLNTTLRFFICRVGDSPVVHFSQVDCRGAEDSFADCTYIVGSGRCRRNNFVGIRCCELF